MQEKITTILGIFLKQPKEQINSATVIDRSVLGSSILVHRMYAKLAAEGVVVKDYQQVRTLGDLLQKLESNVPATRDQMPVIISVAPGIAEAAFTQPEEKDMPGVGIDIEMVSAMPVAGDFREEPFYTMNFSPSEISYCILQPKPYVSFAGLFAAKEAIVKADNRFRNTVFKNVVIRHFDSGKPFFTGFNLSITHTDEIAVAVALPVRNNQLTVKQALIAGPAAKSGNMPGLAWLLLFASIFLSAIALFLVSKRG